MLSSTALPQLEVLPAVDLSPHEDCDPLRVDRLSQRLNAEGILKNPPVVARIPDTERYVILDGANRVMAFRSVGLPHIVAQVVSYADPGLSLETWHHVVCGMAWSDLASAILRLDGLQAVSCSQNEGRQAVENGEAAAYLIYDQGILKLQAAPGGSRDGMRYLHAIVGAYRGRAEIIRASNDIWEIQKPCYPDITALFVFRRLLPEEIFKAGNGGEKIPSGLSRHVIPARALNINIPMQVLAADWPLEQKQAWLETWWQDRLTNNSIRYYAESTFSFNE